METLDIHIREAGEHDEWWVDGLMHRALDAYYDGDHHAVAKQIFSGRMDHASGPFSFEQRMFIAEANGEIAGMVHIGGRYQGTYKINPLIVVEGFRGGFGIGRRLLARAEAYARSREARQVYCMVAVSNERGMRFLARQGFVHAATTNSRYKAGEREALLYRPLYGTEALQMEGEATLPFLARMHAWWVSQKHF